jgi:predicted PurR-regulated permease PerM
MIKKYPFYMKATAILLGLVLLVYILYNLKNVLVPLAFSWLLAMLLNPVATRLQQRKWPRVLAIVASLVVAFIVIAAVAWFLESQIARFTDQLPLLKQRFTKMLTQLQQEINHRMGINMQRQEQVINDAQEKMKPLVGQTLGTIAGTLFMIFLLPVYTFLFMYYKNLLLNFIFEVFSQAKEVGPVLGETKGAIQNYMVGLLVEALIVATLNSVALLLLGIDYALLIGVLGAVLNVLPYIGGIVSTALPVLMAIISKDGYQTPLAVVGAYLLIQFIDNQFLVPYIVSSRVKINALISIVIVLLGDALWGIPGMFLSIPFVGILKLVFDRIPELKPWGKLLGDEVPVRHKGQLLRKKSNKVAKIDV